MIAGSKAAAKTEQEAKKVREADPFDVFQDIIHISPAQPVLFEGGSFCILLSDEETDGSGCSGIFCPIITQRQFFTSDRDLKNCWT